MAPVQTLPPAPASMILGRDRIEPGAVHVVAADPSLGLIYEETGAVQITLTTPVVVTRAGTGGEPGPQETIPANTVFTFNTGDSFLWPVDADGVVPNESNEAATAIVSIIYPNKPATPTPQHPANRRLSQLRPRLRATGSQLASNRPCGSDYPILEIAERRLMHRGIGES